MPTNMLIAGTLALFGSPVRDLIADGLRIGVGFVWLLAGTRKMHSPASTLDTVVYLLGGPGSLRRTIARMLAPAEIVLGLLFIFGWQVRVMSLLSALAFFTFACLIARATIRGALPKDGCGCFGRRSHNLELNDAGPKAIARNLALATLAIAAGV